MKIIDNPVLNVIYIVIFITTLYTTVTGISFLVVKSLEPINKLIGKIKGYYTYDDTVPETRNYTCRVCNNTVVKIKYMRFDYCEDHSKWEKIKSIWKINIWKESGIDSEKSEERTNKKLTV